MRVPIPEAAERLGISTDTVRRRLRSGKLTGVLEDGRWLVDVADAPPPDGLRDSRDLVIEILREQLAARTREVSELHVLLARAAPDRRPWYRRLLPSASRTDRGPDADESRLGDA